MKKFGARLIFVVSFLGTKKLIDFVVNEKNNIHYLPAAIIVAIVYILYQKKVDERNKRKES